MTTPVSPPPLHHTTPAPVSPIPVLPAPPPRRRWVGCLGWSLFVLLLTILFLLLSYRRAPTARLPRNGVPIPLSEFTTRLQANPVRTLIVDRNEVRGEFVTAAAASGRKIRPISS